jgi:glutamyl-tRNA synthetase
MNTKKQLVVTRFAPSPTGDLHIGSLRTALYAYAMAKHNKGEFILRIEDTDQKREIEGAVEGIKTILSSFGMLWEKEFTQSTRAKAGIYAKFAQQLVEQGNAFYCQCEGRNAKTEGYSTELRDPCRNLNLTSGAIKLKTPDNEIVSFFDIVCRKKISWNTNDVADTTLLKSDGLLPTYHLGVVVDDNEMNITHVFRGGEWLSSTPIHLLIYKYLQYEIPEIGHLTSIQDPEGGKLSKRNGSVSCKVMLAEGYLKEALNNFVILLGWAPKDNKEMFTLDEFVQAFDLEGLQKANPVFNRVKLNWFNREYIKQLSDSEFLDYATPFLQKLSYIPAESYSKILPLLRERISFFGEILELDQAGELKYFFEAPQISDISQIIWKTSNQNETKENLHHVLNLAKEISEDNFTKEKCEEILMPFAAEKGKGNVLWPLRFLLSGKEKSPDPFTLLEIIGKNESLLRIQKVIEKL